MQDRFRHVDIRGGSEQQRQINFLTSAHGDELLVRYPTLMQDLYTVTSTILNDERSIQQANLGDPNDSYGRLLLHRRGFSGLQSYIFQLSLGGQDYIVKVAQHPESNPLHQPYFNEMEQIEDIKANFGRSMQAVKMDLPIIHIATEDLCLEQLAPGHQLTDRNEIYIERQRALGTIAEYIFNQQNAGDTLWQNIDLDTHYPDERMTIKTENFVFDSSTGIIWLVDPFIYRMPGTITYASVVSRLTARKLQS